MTTIITDNGQMYNTPGFWTTAGALVAGSAAHSAVKKSNTLIAEPLIKTMKETSQSCDNKTLRAAINDAFTSAKLSENGVELLDVKQVAENKLRSFDFFNKTKNVAYLKEPVVNKKLHEALLNSLPKFLRKTNYSERIVNLFEYIFKTGNNAAYLPKTKKIAINIDKLGVLAFHEMGHAINHNQSKIWKVVQGMRVPTKVASGVFALTALFKRKKLEGEHPVNTFDKVTTFVKDNVGKLVLASAVPIVAEELMATYRGNKMAKKLLPAEMFAKVRKTNRLCAVTYITAAVLSAIAARAASEIRDKVAEPKLAGQRNA